MGVLGKLLTPPSELYDAMIENYRNSGLAVELLPKDSPEALEGSPCIKVRGKNVDLVQVRMPKGTVETATGGGFRPSFDKSEKVSSPTFEFDHIMKGLGTRRPDDLKAELKTETKGTLTKTPVDIRWEGGRLAEVLNDDSDLKERMIKLGVTSFNVAADPENDCVRVEYDGKVKNIVESSGTPTQHTTTRFENLPSIDIFNLCDRIVGHTKSL